MAAPSQSALQNETGKAAMMPAQNGEVPRPKNPMWFPLGYADSMRQWWSAVTPKIAEYQVMSYVPHLQKPPQHPEPSYQHQGNDPSELGTEITITSSQVDPYGPRSWSSSLVELSGKDRALNEFSVTRDGEEVEDNLVMLHGYGAGLGFFYKNFEGLSRVNGWKVYALDMLGMGRSSRPNFKIHAKDQQGKISEAENWFIDALEEWRKIRKLETFTLLGHSMGGYMAVAYALKYPGHLNKLILASPVGIPEDPYAMAAAMPESGDITAANESPKPQQLATGNEEPSPAPRKRQLPRWMTYAWDMNVSPFSIIRWSGPLGPRFASGWTSRRFAHLPPDEAQALHHYSVSLFSQTGSGEYALAYILAPGAFARSPLIRRMAGLGRQPLPSSILNGTATTNNDNLEQVSSTTKSPDTKPAHFREAQKEHGFPVVFMYGSNDWMDKEGGMASVKILEETRRKTLEGKSQEERDKDQGAARVVVIDDAGHHLYLDGWEQFNEVIRREMRDTSQETRKMAAKIATF